MTTFETGKTYFYRFISDYDCVVQVKVIKRTAKTITLQDVHGGDVVTRRVSVMDDCERVNPLGSYSMSPVLRAVNVVEEPEQVQETIQEPEQIQEDTTDTEPVREGRLMTWKFKDDDITETTTIRLEGADGDRVLTMSVMDVTTLRESVHYTLSERTGEYRFSGVDGDWDGRIRRTFLEAMTEILVSPGDVQLLFL